MFWGFHSSIASFIFNFVCWVDLWLATERYFKYAAANCATSLALTCGFLCYVWNIDATVARPAVLRNEARCSATAQADGAWSINLNRQDCRILPNKGSITLLLSVVCFHNFISHGLNILKNAFSCLVVSFTWSCAILLFVVENTSMTKSCFAIFWDNTLHKI